MRAWFHVLSPKNNDNDNIELLSKISKNNAKLLSKNDFFNRNTKQTNDPAWNNRWNDKLTKVVEK